MPTPARAKPIVVVKVGSSSITDGAMLSAEALRHIAADIIELRDAGTAPILVTSGAIAAGRGAIGSNGHPSDLADLQAFAAVGQGLVMQNYTDAFSAHGVSAAQVLFTAHDFGLRTPYLNARRALLRLLEWNVIPIVNENDATATDEITLGENDRLSALVATLVKAQLLVILTDTAGVFTDDPRLRPDAQLIEEVADVDRAMADFAAQTQSAVGTGGMVAKLAAAKIASWSGIRCVIASSRDRGALRRIWNGDQVGTQIHSKAQALPARKVWIAFARIPRGHVEIDDGAVRAICRGGKSLLPVGVRAVTGDFERGDAVEVRDGRGELMAKGLAAISAAELRGRNDADDGPLNEEAIHRDDLVVLREPSA